MIRSHDDVCFVLDQHAKLDFHSDSPWVDMSLNLDYEPTSLCSYYLMLHIFGLTRLVLNPKNYHTRGEHTNHCTNDVVLLFLENLIICFFL